MNLDTDIYFKDCDIGNPNRLADMEKVEIKLQGRCLECGGRTNNHHDTCPDNPINLSDARIFYSNKNCYVYEGDLPQAPEKNYFPTGAMGFPINRHELVNVIMKRYKLTTIMMVERKTD